MKKTVFMDVTHCLSSRSLAMFLINNLHPSSRSKSKENKEDPKLAYIYQSTWYHNLEKINTLKSRRHEHLNSYNSKHNFIILLLLVCDVVQFDRCMQYFLMNVLHTPSG
jgi:hypothetical protein